MRWAVADDISIGSAWRTSRHCHCVFFKYSSTAYSHRFISSLVLQNRFGGNSLRLGQIQAAEKKEEVNSLALSDEPAAVENGGSPHGRAGYILARANDRHEVPLELGFNLARSILLNAKAKQSSLSPINHIGSGGEYYHQTTGTLYGEVKSVSQSLLLLDIGCKM